MPLFGLYIVSIVAIVAAIRSEQLRNKAIVLAVWAVTAAYTIGL